MTDSKTDDRTSQTSRRRWLWVAIASVIQMVALLSLAAAAVHVADGAYRDAAFMSAIGLTLVPLALAVVALGTRVEEPGMAMLKAMGSFIIITLTGGLLTPALGIALAMAVASTFVLSPTEDDLTKPRFISIALFAAYLFVLLFIAPPAAVFAMAALPLFVVAITDTTVVRVRSNRA